MREDLLHFIWKYKRLQLQNLTTSKNEQISIADVGAHNHLAGPDFFNAKITINGQLWAGNVEIHIKSSDWYAHNHEQDMAYDNVILHVVWEDDAEVFRKDTTEIPTLELKHHISKSLLRTYENLFDRKHKSFINCEKDIAQVDTLIFLNWSERLFFERLERKSDFVYELLHESRGDWEQVLFSLLLKNFGSKINGEAFLSLARALNFSLVRRLALNARQLESVLFGMSHLLDDDTVLDTYHIELKKEYLHLKNKFGLNAGGVQKPEFFKLRPLNFPTIRMSQFANLYANHRGLFRTVINANSLQELYAVFDVSVSPYWENHFTFGKLAKKKPKKMTRKFIDLLIINSILPLKFCHAKYLGKEINDSILGIGSDIKTEENNIITNFKIHGMVAQNAMESQAMLQLYNEYCTMHRCLHCAVGSSLLQAPNG